MYHAGHQLVFTGPSWCLCGQLPGIQLAVRHLLDLAVLLAAVRVFFARSLLIAGYIDNALSAICCTIFV